MARGRPKRPLLISDEQRAVLEGWSRRHKSANGLAQRARRDRSRCARTNADCPGPRLDPVSLRVLRHESSYVAAVSDTGVTGPRAYTNDARPHWREAGSLPARVPGQPIPPRGFRLHGRILVLAAPQEG